MYDKKSVKTAAVGRWDQIFHALAPALDEAQKTPGKHVPCPVHGGRNGFRLFPRYDQTGAGICNTCGAFTDGFAVLCWINGWSFPQAVNAVGNFLRLTPGKDASTNVQNTSTKFVGRILFMGYEQFRSGKCFTIRLRTQSGETVVCRGVDLKRAAEAAHLVKGNWVSLCRLAEQEVRLVDGRNVRKFLWSAFVVESPEETSERLAQEKKELALESEQKRMSIEKFWAQTRAYRADDPVCEPMKRYLARRGVEAAAFEETELRFMPNCLYAGSKEEEGARKFYPAMVAAVRDNEGNLVTVHRTYLRPEGIKAPVFEPKKLMSVPYGETINGCAVKLQSSGSILCVAEGIETSLSVTAATGYPCWSCISAHGLTEFVPPKNVRTVLIFADKDASGVGDEAAEKLRARLADSGLLAIICRIPDPIPAGGKGLDWNDVLRAKGPEAFPVRAKN